MEKIKALMIKYKGLIFYAVFGVLTTVINIVAYALCFMVLGLANVPSVIIAWLVAVLFAFITNKLWVFDSKSMDKNTVISELIKFMAARLATGGIDLLIMYIGVDMMHGPEIILKAVSNVIVIILNYILSRLIVFKKK
ncbi:MAG: GtrA family protein [Clostridiales bacterium]|nr:GtrA family protein [Clostridiales bacterium]